MSQDKARLLGQHEAIEHYLDALLQEVPEPAPSPEPDAPPPLPKVMPSLAPAVAEAEPEVQAPVVTEMPVAPQQVELPEELKVEPDTPLAEDEFQCLLFDVSGLTLAIPLISLSAIAKWPEEVTVLPGKPDWYLGLTAYRERQSSVIDTARVVFPSYQYEKIVQQGQPWSNIIFIGDGSWGLACHGIKEVVTLSQEGVKWRSERGTRPWLAGTVIEQMCALLDITAFVSMLTDVRGDR